MEAHGHAITSPFPFSNPDIQSSDHVPGSDPFQHDAFVFAAATRLNVDTRWRNGTLTSQEPDEFAVGRAVRWWSRHADFQRVTVNAHTFCDGCVRLDMDREKCSVFGILHNRKIHPR